MHKSVLGALIALASLATAQSPLTTAYTSNNGNSAGGAVYFDLTINTSVTFTQVDVNVGNTAGTAGSIEVYIGCPTLITTWLNNASSPLPWLLMSTGAGTAAGLNLPTTCVLATPFTLDPGTYAMAIKNVAPWTARYTNGNGTNQVFSNTDMTLSAGGSANAAFAGTPFNPRVYNGSLHYTIGGTGPAWNCGNATAYGNGCYFGATSYYESLAAQSSFDLGGGPGTENVVRMTAIGAAGYAVAAAPSAWFAPAGTQLLNNAATPGQITDDNYTGPLALPFTFSFPGGSTTVVHACANGYIRLGAMTLTGGDFSPTVAELLGTPTTSANNGPRLAPMWADLYVTRNLTLNPAAGMYFDVDPSGNTVYVTWLDVGEFANSTAGASSINMQVALHSNGDVEYRYGTCTIATGSSATIVGWSKGFASPPTNNPGSVDISASMPFATNGPDAIPLGLRTTGSRPILGANVGIETFNIPATAFGTFNLLGFGAVVPGIDLGGFGMPGCSQNIALAGADSLFLVGAPTASRSFLIPNNGIYKGSLLFTQSLSLVPGVNAFGGLTSNGVSLYVGAH